MSDLIFNTPPNSKQILKIIAVGAVMFSITLIYITYDVRISSFRNEYWGLYRANSDELIDTLHVRIRPDIELGNGAGLRVNPNIRLGYEKHFMSYNPLFLAWMALISVMTGFSASLSFVLSNEIKDLKRIFNLDRKDMRFIYLFTAAIALGIYFTKSNKHVQTLFELMEDGKILVWHPRWLEILVIISLVAGCFAVAGQLTINKAIDTLAASVNSLAPQAQKDQLKRFKFLSAKLKGFLMIGAVLIVFTIITTDMLRRAVLAEIILSDKHNIFPREFVYLYGMIFTFFLALVYLPIHYRLKYKGECMVQELDAKNEEARHLVDSFTLKETPLENFKVAFSILAPVVSSLVPELLKI